MEEKIIRNVRYNNIKSLILFIILGLLPNFGFFYALVGEAGENTTLYLIIFGALAVLMDYLVIKILIVVINPLSSNVFKKYGSPKELAKILDEIESTKEYEDKRLIISKNYVMEKKDYESILAFDNVLAIHKEVHKTNGAIDGYSVIITDKYGFETKYSYGSSKKEQDKVDSLIMYIGSKCKNAEFGYTKQAQQHVRNNKVELIDKTKENYACPDCNEPIAYNEKFCKNCGCKLDWNNDKEN